ncbi:MAG: HDOD domain-containing protein [Desulfamplus sp.]|nr:HDOD domain-containing protein [Desulfamplus sp.]
MGDKMTDSIQARSGIELDLLVLPDMPELNDDEQNQTAISTSFQTLEKKSVQSSGTENDHEQIGLSKILESLDKRMKSGQFLHTFTAQIEEINRIINLKYASTKDIASVILKDVALSSKVLSVVNSCYYGQFSSSGISSIPEAMIILGTEEVQQTAATLLLFEFMRDISKSELLKEKSLASLMRGMMAKEIAESAKYKAPDEFQIAAMLYDIGEQIILFCEPELYQRICRISEQKNIEMEIVAKKIIGASFSYIGRKIVSGWGFPKSIVDCLQPFKEFDIDPENLSGTKLKRLVASFTNELSSIDWRISEFLRQKKLEDVIRRYGHFLNIGLSGADGLLNSAIKKVENHARILRITLKNSRFDRTSDEQSSDLKLESAKKLWDIARITPDIHLEGLRRGSEENTAWIESNIKKIEDALTTSFKLSEILHLIITTIYKGFFFSKISICIMNRKTGIMAVRLVLGDDSDQFSKNFKFAVSDSNDTFNKSLSTGLDIVVQNINDKAFNSRIPDWYIKGNFAGAFALYPIVVEQKKIGLIYVDWHSSRTPLFSDHVKQLMQRLKNLTATAIKKSRKENKK